MTCQCSTGLMNVESRQSSPWVVVAVTQFPGSSLNAIDMFAEESQVTNDVFDLVTGLEPGLSDPPVWWPQFCAHFLGTILASTLGGFTVDLPRVEARKLPRNWAQKWGHRGDIFRVSPSS